MSIYSTLKDIMEIKYQIFISSTFEDLKEEREQELNTVLEMGHIPVGMELFSAGNETQWELIKRQIDDCDYYIEIVAHRYVSLDGDISYTEKEYDYALTKNSPIFGFVIDKNASWISSKIDNDEMKRNKLNSFKEKIKQKTFIFWKDKNTLYAKVPTALTKEFEIHPQVGWTKANNNKNALL